KLYRNSSGPRNTWSTKRSALSLWITTWQKAEPSPSQTRPPASNSKRNIQRRLHFTIAARFLWTQFSLASRKISCVFSVRTQYSIWKKCSSHHRLPLGVGRQFCLPRPPVQARYACQSGKVVSWFFILLIPQSYQVGFQLASPQLFEVETNI